MRELRDKWCSVLGMPKHIYSDNERAFTAADFKRFTEQEGVDWTCSSVYCHRQNGHVERVQRNLKEQLDVLMRETDRKDWPRQVSGVVLRYNAG